MLISMKSLVRKELIGKKAEIVRSDNPSLSGLKGIIVDETKNLLTIRSDEGRKFKAIKSQVTIKVDNNKIKGTKIQKRPEERIKSK